MKRLLLSTVAAFGGALAISSAASAAVTITVDPTVTDYTSDLLAVPNSQIVWDFDTIFKTGFSFTPSSAVVNGTTCCSVEPLNDTTNYAAVQPTNQPATFTSTQLMKSFSFLVGTPDFYNRIVFSGPSGVIADLSGSTGMFGPVPTNQQDQAYRITYNFGSSLVNRVDFYSQFNALEFDRIAAGVPEPATWAMMLLGFFGMGALLRRKRTPALNVA